MYLAFLSGWFEHFYPRKSNPPSVYYGDVMIELLGGSNAVPLSVRLLWVTVLSPDVFRILLYNNDDYYSEEFVCRSLFSVF